MMKLIISLAMNLESQQTNKLVQMQEHSFKNLKGGFAFWYKNPNRSTQSDTLKNILQLWTVVPISRVEPEHVFSVTDSFVTETRARLGDDSVDYKRLVQKNVEFVLNLDTQKFWGIQGILEEERFIPHSPGNEIFDSSYSSFPEEQQK